MGPIRAALRGKGPLSFAQRAVSIVTHYGVTSSRIDRALEHFAVILDRFQCRATFPITAVVLARNREAVRKYHGQGVEFAIHGYRHVDHCQLSRAEQLAQLAMAKQLFDNTGIDVKGFRGPYLHANSDTLMALQLKNLVYDSSQGISWEIPDGLETAAYQHVLDFYGALSASAYPSLPSMDGGLVRIPYSLPDDEALVHRLSPKTTDDMSAIWLAILHRSYELGELFTLGLHPERVFACQEPLKAVLSEARQLDPPVWIARLSEIASWWRSRNGSTLEMSDAGNGTFRVTVVAPSDATVLARGVKVDAPTRPWADGYEQVLATTFAVHAASRPCIGLSPTTSRMLSSFVRQQGYGVDITRSDQGYAYYLDRPDFTAEDQRPLLTQIEGTDRPLVRVGRWPGRARSVLSVTGDIDAFTLWDYGLRTFGR